jgi:DNA polymerase III sliding clamp (beta) subunit (PCNA family)
MENTVMNFPEGDLKITTTRSEDDRYTKSIHLSPEGQRKKYKVACDPYENDFPHWPKEETPEVLVKFKTNIKEFQERVKLTGQNVDPQDPTQVYQNISLVNNDGKIKFVAGNSHLCLGVDSQFEIQDNVVIPALVSKCISQLTESGEADITVTDKILYLKYANLEMKLKMYEMVAPPYMTLFHQEPEKGITVDRLELLGALRRMMGVGMKTHRLVMECVEGSLKLYSANDDFGHEGEEFIDFEGEGKWMVGANCLYMKNAMSSSKADKVHIKVVGDGSQIKPIFVCPEGDSIPVKWLIMPVAILRGDT